MTDERQEQEPQAQEREAPDLRLDVAHGERSAPAVEGVEPKPRAQRAAVFSLENVTVSYGDKPAVRDITFDIGEREITALIGPSGCGKSTLIRCLIGMVFQKPNPFPKSIYDNIAFGPRVLGMKSNMDEIVERALRHAVLWDEVKDRLKTNAFGMSGGQQQRLCIARCLAVEPDVILMDEPCSALDPISTGRIEDLMTELKEDYSIVIVTHNMQQAARVSDMTAFLIVQLDASEKHRTGRIVEYDETEKIFTNPSDQRTEDYVT